VILKVVLNTKYYILTLLSYLLRVKLKPIPYERQNKIKAYDTGPKPTTSSSSDTSSAIFTKNINIKRGGSLRGTCGGVDSSPSPSPGGGPGDGPRASRTFALTAGLMDEEAEETSVLTYTDDDSMLSISASDGVDMPISPRTGHK
jgi:hypothetical protein